MINQPNQFPNSAFASKMGKGLQLLASGVRSFIRRSGYDIVRYRPPVVTASLPIDVSEEDRQILAQVAPFTLTTTERLLALISATRYIVHAGILGSIVECGVWRGGSMMAAAKTLISENDTSRNLYLFDTFEGMTEPNEVDRNLDEIPASRLLNQPPSGTDYWCISGIDEVRTNLHSIPYPEDKLHFVKGMVEQTLPDQSPNYPIALLRLDTDWYESTKHELQHLFPLLNEGGVLIIDDYGHWQGARKATDEFLAKQEKTYYLHRIDYTGRLLIK